MKMQEINLYDTDVIPSELKIILHHLRLKNNPHYLEVGVYGGGTFKSVLYELNGGGYAVGIDLFEDLQLEFEKYDKEWKFDEVGDPLEDCRTQTHHVWNKSENKLNTVTKDRLESELKKTFDNFELLKGYSDDILPKLNHKFDVIFIDANHSYYAVKKDFENCYPLANDSAFFIFHNITKVEMEVFYKDGSPYRLFNELKSDNRLEVVDLSMFPVKHTSMGGNSQRVGVLRKL